MKQCHFIYEVLYSVYWNILFSLKKMKIRLLHSVVQLEEKNVLTIFSDDDGYVSQVWHKN